MSRQMGKFLNPLILSFFIASATMTVQSACDIKPISELSAEDGIIRLRSLHRDESWERLVQEVNEYRSRFPYSQYATEAELLQGDAYFKTSRFPEAIANYEDFLRRNPSHQQADLALFRVAKAYDLQCPEDAEREQATAKRAIEKYQELQDKFARSSFVPEAVERSSVLRKRLADHHLFVANFYWKKSLYHAALTRYLFVIDNFSEQKEAQLIALSRASESYLRLAELLEKNPNSDSVSYFRSQTPLQLKEKSVQLIEQKKALLGGSAIETSKKEG
jgi:outer membrane protein assembly factor BamD